MNVIDLTLTELSKQMLSDWFHGLSGHLTLLFSSTAGFICMMCRAL